MGAQTSQAVSPDLRQFWKPPFQYSLLITSTLAPKLLHLYLHFTSLPVLLYILYLPTFLALDVLNAIFFWGFVHLTVPGRFILVLALARCAFCLIVLSAASMQIAFYFETGGEIKWGAAKNFAHDPAGMKVLLSGGMQACIVSTIIVIFARVVSHPLYAGAESLFRKVVKTVFGHWGQSWTERQGVQKDSIEGDLNDKWSPHCVAVSSDGDDCFMRDGDDLGVTSAALNSRPARCYTLSNARITIISTITTTVSLLVLRPTSFPYAHMSGSLPFTLTEIWDSNADFCQAGFSEMFEQFPFPSLVSSELWEPANGKYPGWEPTANISVSEQLQPLHPSWLPEEPITGFERWYSKPKSSKEEPVASFPPHRHRERKGVMKRGPAYDPIQDPMRISNLNQDLLQPISRALKTRKVAIKHVVLLSLESTRSDVFPLTKNSHLYDLIIRSHESNESIAKAISDLSQMTPNAEILTGENGGFEGRDRNESLAKISTWRNLGKDRGGINVVGAFTGSTTSLKSMLGSLCGVQPLPVDFTVEESRGIYQPCIPQILELFNHDKSKGHNYSTGKYRNSDDANSMLWRSVYAQSITDQYDHQDKLNRNVGFSEVIVKDTLLDPSSKHYPPTEKESNYFGFPENQLKPYLEDLFREAEKNKQRLFLSHLTSSSHHSWNTPEAAGKTVDYLGRGKWGSEHPLNRYLNTIRYADRWVSEIMDMLEDLGVADETLVVIVGDHGMAFEEDSAVYTTFENGHIKNMNVPLVFHHPSLPRIKLAVNATSLSIIPTLLDLLVTTSSLNSQDKDVASNLMHQYEGQSLLRPYIVEKHGRQAWNIGVLNAGGAILSVSSAAVPFRLVIPVCKSGVFRFTDTALDPNELSPVEEYSVSALAARVRQENSEAAAKWVVEAEKIGKWWVLEQRRRWGYHGAGLVKDRDPKELHGAGTVKKEHWWNT